MVQALLMGLMVARRLGVMVQASLMERVVDQLLGIDKRFSVRGNQ
jgi:hypothetical protein